MPIVTPSSDLHEPAGIARGAPYFPELECLRGIAIALVVLFHADSVVRAPFHDTVGMWPSLPLALLLGGHTGVSLFFVLSGFLLGLPFLAEMGGGRHVDRRLYYRRRALRILPIYWAVLALAIVVTVRAPGELLPRLGYFVFLNGVPNLVAPMRPFTDVVWSLATEVQFYAVLPLLPFCFRTRTRAITLVLLFGILYLALLVGPLRTSPIRDFLTYGVFGRLPQFAAGIGAAWLYRRRHARGVTPEPLLGRGAADLALLACLAALAALVRPVIHGGYFAWNLPPGHVWHVPEGVLWAIVLLLVLEGRLFVQPLLVNSPLARLGVLSYSIYLLHMPVLAYSMTAARRRFGLPDQWSSGNGAWLVAAVVATVSLSAVTYRLIEEPFLRRKASLPPTT